MYKMKKTLPAMSNCPIKSGVILEKGVCDDRALQRKPIKIRSHQKKISTCSSAGSHCTRQPRQPAAAALLLSSAWLQTLVSLSLFQCFSRVSMFCVWELESGYLSIDKRVAVTPLLIVGDNLSPALVTQPRSAWKYLSIRLFLCDVTRNT